MGTVARLSRGGERPGVARLARPLIDGGQPPRGQSRQRRKETRHFGKREKLPWGRIARKCVTSNAHGR
eukprot:7534796-Pyramimonas_sp.AAC.1